MIMKITLLIVGGVLIVWGLIWGLQGLNVLPGSSMSGQTMWAGIGSCLAAVGLVLVVIGARTRSL